MSEKMLPSNFTDEGYARFEADWLAWQSGDPPPLWKDYLPAPNAPCSADLILMLMKVDIEFRIKAGLPALLAERYFEHPRLQQEDARLDAGQQMELIEWEYQQCWQNGQPPQRAEYAAAFPQHADAIRELKPHMRCPRCHQIIKQEETYQTFVCLACENADKMAADLPKSIGRYRVDRVLGEGGFGLVYLAHDDQLQRPVAIKVPHRHLVSGPKDAEPYLSEARTVASLDHPNIVPVYDVGSSEEYPIFIVSRYIDGSTLIARIKSNRPSVAETAELAATVAETLDHAHKKGLVHRDIKPGNILLDANGKPYVADFGLALRETDVGKGSRYAGTPAYMSPEQARGEGYRVEGRSDLFSLGVVFYELLTGRRPFRADSIAELLEQIASMEIRPPRQWDDTIPKELERICLKALSKRASDRYSTGKDMADDLRSFFEKATEDEKRSLRSSVPAANAPSPVPASTPVADAIPTPISDGPVRIVPKGLHS